jgi:hypothetical protein
MMVDMPSNNTLRVVKPEAYKRKKALLKLQKKKIGKKCYRLTV